ATELEIFGSVTLDDGGYVKLSGNSENAIVSNGSPATLTNYDTISGAGIIGDVGANLAGANLTLVNLGTINANIAGTLVLATGNLLVNNSGAVLEATNGGTLKIEDTITNTT